MAKLLRYFYYNQRKSTDIVQTTNMFCCQSFHNNGKSNKITTSGKMSISYENEELKRVRWYVVKRYIDYVRNYEKVIETKFPTAMHLYRTFKIGIKHFYQDLVAYVKIVRNLNANGMESLTLQEMEIYYKMPKDMLKVAPVLLLSALPMTNYIIFPLAYLYPRQMLCAHFWTIQQRSEFQIYYLKQRLLSQRATFRCMQLQLDALNERAHHLYKDCSQILGLIGSGAQPTAQHILHCKQLFAEFPYHISYLKGNHVKNLLKIHGLHTFVWFRRTRLSAHAKLLLAMDQAILREPGGGVGSLTHDTLKSACFLRGLNPTNMKTDDMIKWLEQWLQVSQCVDHTNLSLLLHCPILLAYNQPNNWLLIY